MFFLQYPHLDGKYIVVMGLDQLRVLARLEKRSKTVHGQILLRLAVTRTNYSSMTLGDYQNSIALYPFTLSLCRFQVPFLFRHSVYPAD
jgi:hypothetical protein